MFANLRISQPRVLGLAQEDIQKRFTEGSVVLKRFLLTFSDLIFDSRVDPGMPSFAAAPDGPDTRPPLSRRAASMISFSWAAGFRDSPRWLFGLAAWGCRESQLPSTAKFPASHTITDRSMMFCNSRILPGQAYVTSRSRLFLFTA